MLSRVNPKYISPVIILAQFSFKMCNVSGVVMETALTTCHLFVFKHMLNRKRQLIGPKILRFGNFEIDNSKLFKSFKEFVKFEGIPTLFCLVGSGSILCHSIFNYIQQK